MRTPLGRRYQHAADDLTREYNRLGWMRSHPSARIGVMRWSPRDAVASYGRSMVPHSLADVAPGLAMLVHYPRAYLRSDVLAGLTVGAVAVPASLAMAELAGVPVVYGLYGTLLPLAVYGLLGSSRQHVIGPDATLAALTAVTVAPLAVVGGEPDPGRYLALTAALALTMGLLLFAAGVLRLGFVADFFGKPVLLGYINGVALIVIASQLGKLFGITVEVDEFFPIIREVIGDLGDANGPTVLLSAVLLAVAVAVKQLPSGRAALARRPRAGPRDRRRGGSGGARHRGSRRGGGRAPVVRTA